MNEGKREEREGGRKDGTYSFHCFWRREREKRERGERRRVSTVIWREGGGRKEVR